MISLLSHIPEVAVVHSPQDAMRVEDREPSHRLLSDVHFVADVTRESAGVCQEHVLIVGSRGIFAATVLTGRIQVPPCQSPQCKGMLVLYLNKDHRDRLERLP